MRSHYFFTRLSCLLVLIGFFNSCSTASRPTQTKEPALKDVFKDHFSIGCLLSYAHVAPGTEGDKLIGQHMNTMSPGNNMKPDYILNIAAAERAYNSAKVEDREKANRTAIVSFPQNLIDQLNWAKDNNFGFRGHTLVWHSQTPTAFFREGWSKDGDFVSPEIMDARLNSYIGEVMRLIHKDWPDMFIAMDVVNEAIDDGSAAVRTTKNDWYTVYKNASYIEKAFEYTKYWREYYGEAQIILYYNDYNTHNSRKADGIVKLLKPLYEKELLEGIGLQEHNSLYSPSKEAWIASYNKFAKICNEISITELDVSTGANTNWPSEAILKKQAEQYKMLFTLYKERSLGSGNGKIANVSKDGLNDEYTFKKNQSSSLWDENFEPKPAFWAIVGP